MQWLMYDRLLNFRCSCRYLLVEPLKKRTKIAENDHERKVFIRPSLQLQWEIAPKLAGGPFWTNRLVLSLNNYVQWAELQTMHE